MDYNFFLDQLTQVRQKFALPPSVAVIEGGVSVDVDSVSYDTSKREIFIKYPGCDDDWKLKYEEREEEFEKLTKRNKSLEKSLEKADDSLEFADGEIETLKLYQAELVSNVEDQEIEIEDLKEEIKKLKSEV